MREVGYVRIDAPRHSEANLLHRLQKSTRLKRCFPEAEYQYSFRAARTESQAKRIEEALIKSYVKRYGEVPPLNSAIPNRYRERGW